MRSARTGNHVKVTTDSILKPSGSFLKTESSMMKLNDPRMMLIAGLALALDASATSIARAAGGH